MNKYIINIGITILIISLIAYLICSICTGSFDVSTWEKDFRYGLATSIGVLTAIGVMVILYILIDI